MDDRLIVALDVNNENKALGLVRLLKNDVSFFKVGLELFTSCGSSIVKAIKAEGCEIFLDLKLHDIPNTVAKTSCVMAGLGVSLFNVHALGGFDMMEWAAKAAEAKSAELKVEKPKILAVTILTSMNEAGIRSVGIGGSVKDEVLKLASLAQDAGLEGVVASPEEAAAIRKNAGKDFIIVTPGVRPEWAAKGDQKRVATPREAIQAGASHIVVGRPITDAKDPAQAARKVLKEIAI